MQKISLKYRTWHKGVCPSPIKLEIPGWAGNDNSHSDGDTAEPWHCKPFVDASTYGLELVYPFETECHVKNVNGSIVFEGDFSEESRQVPEVPLPPFISFSSGHFGMTSALDVRVPEDCVLRTEPHPAFYTDTTGTFPCCIPGHIQTYWWPKIFFVVFKNPPPGGETVFRKGLPYGQVLVVPKKIVYEIQEMTKQEVEERLMTDFFLETNKDRISKSCWVDNKGNQFSDKYKQMLNAFNKVGYEGLKQFVRSFSTMNVRKRCPFFKKVFKLGRNEVLQKDL